MQTNNNLQREFKPGRFDFNEIGKRTVNEVCDELYKSDSCFPYAANCDKGEIMLIRGDKLEEFLTYVLNNHFGYTISIKKNHV